MEESPGGDRDWFYMGLATSTVDFVLEAPRSMYMAAVYFFSGLVRQTVWHGIP